MQDEAADPIVMEALEWFVRMRDDKASAADRRAFRAWLEGDPAHAAALAHAEALWKRFDIVKPEIDRLRRSQKTFSRRNVTLGGVAALLGAGFMTLRSRGDLFADHTTDIGERRTIALADGSAIELGSYSALSVDFTNASRSVRLHRGQGFFDVKDDPARPFIVAAGEGGAQTHAARFDLKYVDDLVTVVASKQAVTVGGAFPGMTVAQGWQISFTGDRPGPLVKADLAITEAWRRDQIIFQDMPLRQVLAEIERYRRGRIILMGGSLGDAPVTAIFSSKQLDNALHALSSTLPIRIFQASTLLTIVYSA